MFDLWKQNDEKEVTVTALKNEIQNLKKKVADQEETIDDLVGDRDGGWDEVYRLKLKLADTWNIRLERDAKRVRQVARRIRCNEGIGSKTKEERSVWKQIENYRQKF